MFVVNDDLSIYATRGDIVFFSVAAEDNGEPYSFQPGDVVRMKVYGKKDAESVVMQKDFPVEAETEQVSIYLTEADTKIGEVISKPKDYWYEIELNPFTNPQTIIGYDEDGARVFKLFPEGDDIPEYVPEPEDIKVIDDELDMTSTRPVQNQAIARAVTQLAAQVKQIEDDGYGVRSSVAVWLEEHPEATTTVQDGAITPAKLAEPYALLKEVVTNAQTDGANSIFGHSSNKIADDVSTSVILGGGSTNYNNVIGGDGANVGTTAENETTAGTGAHVSVVGGYDNSAGSLSSKIISDHSKTEVGGNGHNAIYGGANHTAKSSASFAMIAGGQSNEVSGYGGFVTGIRNICAGQGSAVFGNDNECQMNGGFIAGAANIIKSLFCTCFGSTNTVEAAANFASVFGNYGVARHVGQQVFTAGKIANNGDAQTSVMEMHKQTANGIGTVLGVLGSSSGYKLQPNQSAAFKAMLIGRDNDSTDCASFEVKGLATRGESGNSVIVNSTITSLGASAGASAWRISAVNGASDGGVNIYVVGEEGKTINWVMRMELVEVSV